MNIRPRNKILFAQQGVMFSNNNSRGANWRQLVFANYRLHLLDQLKKYGNDTRYGDWLNEMQDRHSLLYGMAGNNWENVAFKNDLVGQYQHDYKGTGRFGKVGINNNDKYDFNLGIRPNFNSRYNIINPPRRISGDNNAAGNFTVDNLYSAITDDRRILGRKGDWDDQSLSEFNSQLEKLGWTMLLDKNDYYKLRRLEGNKIELPNTIDNKPKPLHDYMKPDNSVVSKFNLTEREKKRENEIAALERADEEAKRNAFREKLISGFRNIAPDALDAARLIGTLHTNNKVFGEMLKGIRPSLQLSYHTYRLVVGDEATKQAYYRRAAQGQTKAAQPFTSDADRQVAYMMEHKRVGDELRAQGDLADNLRIRETSELASLHTDANRERDTTVANNNLLEINKANAAKLLLKALKLLADWTNTDLYLLGAQSKLLLKNNERKLYDRQLAQITMLQDLLNDSNILTLQSKRDKALEAYSNDRNNPTLKKAFEDANKEYQNYMLQKKKNWHEQGLYIAKSGTKLEYKDKSDKFLYKVSKDIVDHFRRITKMTDDSRVRTLPKTVKLTPHPKAKKMLLGGVAPFYIYRPLGLGGGESTVSTQTSTSSSSSKSSSDKKSEAEKDKLDLIKELFKSVSASALPIDTSLIYKDISNTIFKAKALGEELTTDDLASMYLSSMLKLTYLKYSKDAYDKAYNQAVANDAMDEVAVASDNSLFLLDQETGKIKKGTISDILKSEGKLNPLTNGLLLTARAHSPNLAFNDEIFDVVNRGVGMNKIAAQIKNLASTLGSSEQKIEGISQVESNRIKNGLQILAGFDGTPDGYYKITRQTKDSLNNIQAALKYIYGMLPNNYKTIMKLHFGNEENSIKMIQSMLTSLANDSYLESISPLTGKASDKDKEGDLDKLGINSATQLLLGMSSPREFTFSIGNGNVFNGMARVSSITKDGNSMGADFVYSDIYKSDLHKNLDLDNASFGDVPINKALKDRIIIDNSTIAGIDLPYTTDKNGRIIPDFKMLNRIEEADLEILKAGINPETEPQKVNEIYAKHSLPIKYGADNRLTGNYKRFAVILATAIEDVFLDKSGLASNGTLSLVSDEEEINKYINEIKKITGQKEIDIDRPGLFTGNKDIYKGSIFIPIIGDLVDAVSATGGLKAGNYDELRSKYLTKNYNEAPLFVKQ